MFARCYLIEVPVTLTTESHHKYLHSKSDEILSGIRPSNGNVRPSLRFADITENYYLYQLTLITSHKEELVKLDELKHRTEAKSETTNSLHDRETSGDKKSGGGKESTQLAKTSKNMAVTTNKT